jgi:hypothetical protein
MSSEKERMEDSARQLLSRADKILADVDESYIISHRGHKQRLMPVFRPEEISLGQPLGKGGFGIVQEILKFTLDPEDETDGVHEKAQENRRLLIIGTSCSNGTTTSDNHEGRVSTVVSTREEMSENDHVHYDVRKARHWMTKHCLRKGVARYALKRLHGDLNEIERVRGMIDLAVEAKMLSVVWHPNIGTFSRTCGWVLNSNCRHYCVLRLSIAGFCS